MNNKRLSVRIEDTETGEVKELKTNNLFLLTSDDNAKGDKTEHTFCILLHGNTDEKYALAEGYDEVRKTLMLKIAVSLPDDMEQCID